MQLLQWETIEMAGYTCTTQWHMYTLTSCSWFAIFSNLARMLLDWPPVCAHDNITQNFISLTEEVPILTNGSISWLRYSNTCHSWLASLVVTQDKGTHLRSLEKQYLYVMWENLYDTPMGIYNYFYRYSFDLADCHSLDWVWPELKLWMAHISIPSCCLPNIISAKLDQVVWQFQVASKDILLIVTQLNSEQRLWPQLFKCGPYLLSSRLEIGRDVIKGN